MRDAGSREGERLSAARTDPEDGCGTTVLPRLACGWVWAGPCGEAGPCRGGSAKLRLTAAGSREFLEQLASRAISEGRWINACVG